MLNWDVVLGEELDIFGLMKGVYVKLDVVLVMFELVMFDGEIYLFLLMCEGM